MSCDRVRFRTQIKPPQKSSMRNENKTPSQQYGYGGNGVARPYTAFRGGAPKQSQDQKRQSSSQEREVKSGILSLSFPSVTISWATDFIADLKSGNRPLSQTSHFD
eukprot:GHVU01053215.1.p1 GENE.GHVU01053215.1~~GHVU01053215.1.p1  ORF type:complete len:106 (-),score=1.87 GHVU01053215.1:5-322(-)